MLSLLQATDIASGTLTRIRHEATSFRRDQLSAASEQSLGGRKETMMPEAA